MKQLSQFIQEKKLSISNLTKSIEVPGVDTSLAKVTLPDEEDINILSLVENSIKEFVLDNCQKVGFDSKTDLSNLHKFMDVDKIADCQNYVNNQLQNSMMRWAYHVAKSRLCFQGDFYIDKEIYVRINYPYDKALEGQKSSQTDPNHRLTKYNHGRPRSSWGHGPHKDSWYGHSHSAINLWFSVCGTNEDATMTLYPEHAYKDTTYDPESMYASYSEKLGKNVRLKMNNGENFIFDPELLHSTRINTSEETRIVLTLRLSNSEPLFSKDINHDIYDLWVKSDSVKNGDFLSKKVGKKVSINDHPSTDKIDDYYVYEADKDLNYIFNKEHRHDFDIKDGILFEMRFNNGECLAVWSKNKLYKFSKKCPHVGAPLIGAEFDPEKIKIKCPAHGAEFCLKTGNSGSDKLSLKIID
jgi:nitrite reductase/ring-hydroxylating ferredoxin subunit/ectoine hydroxylase-related dioxygenase (phytanoyl-CoA dioxygenase family)